MANKKEGPDFRKVYDGFDETKYTTVGTQVIKSTGSIFAAGTIGGSLYHFTKGLYNTKNLTIATNTARVNGPRLGGILALVSLAVDVPRILYLDYEADKNNNVNTVYALDVATLAAGGGLLRASKGLGSAFRTAAVCGSITAAALLLPVFTENSQVFNSLLYPNSSNYPYPHYRLLQQKEEDGDM